MKPGVLWNLILLFAVICSGCASRLSYEEIAEQHHTFTSGEKRATIDEWHAIIDDFENIIRTNENSEIADDVQFAVASSWVWCIKVGDKKAAQNAISAYRKLIYTYTDSEYLPQAHYWLARCYSHIGDAARAAHHYQLITKQYPDTVLAAKAKLELGHTYKQHGYEKRSETIYLDIVNSENKKDIVSTASDELKQLKTEKNPTTIIEKSKLQTKVLPNPKIKPVQPEIKTITPGSLTREFGLTAKTIVIDAGHGGKDPGGVGTGNLYEKPIALSIAKKISALLKAKGYTVLLTRDTDRFIPLKERTAFATKHKADLFLSIHANASGDSRANGIETYYLDVTSTDKDSEIIAARENANSGYSIQELESLLKGLIVESKSKDSRRLAEHVQRELVVATGAANRGVKHARFVVLIGTSVPAILIETGFVTNPTEATKLTSDAYQQKVASAIVQGVEKFLGIAGQISQLLPNKFNSQLADTKR